ncbi:MAG: glycosyltransferase family 2 protein, partial [Paracoccaceae bacterium]
MGVLGTYRLRLERKKRRVRSLRKRRELEVVENRTAQIAAEDILLCCTLRNERVRLPFFLEYYRHLGVNHFLFIDNDSDDGSREFLERQPDASVWTTTHSYKRSKFGIDWVNGLLARYGSGHWVLVVDVDEFLVYPFCDSRPLRALTDWLESSSLRSFGAMLIDMYPKKPLDETSCNEGQNPFE